MVCFAGDAEVLVQDGCVDSDSGQQSFIEQQLVGRGVDKGAERAT